MRPPAQERRRRAVQSRAVATSASLALVTVIQPPPGSRACGPRRLGVLAGGFAAFSFAGLTWIYVLIPNELESFLSTNGDRVIDSLVVGLVAMAPLLFEEAARRLAGYESARR